MSIKEYTITELAVGMGTVIGAISACLLICFKSRCHKISMCCGLLECDRKVQDKKIPDIELETLPINNP